LPRHGSGAVLVTSRASDFSLADEMVTVDTFEPDVAETFLRNRVRRRNPQASSEPVGAVIERLGGLPLALEQAGAWVAQVPSHTFARFVQLYDDVSSDPFPDGTRPTGYEHTATTTRRVSIAAATRDARLPDRVLAVLAFFAPDAEAPCQWLRDMGDDRHFGAPGPAAIDGALDALYADSLATITADDTISVHRVVQDVTRHAPRPTPRVPPSVVSATKPPGNAGDHQRWPLLAALAPHAAAVADDHRRPA
jgi:hypothetical protein